MNVDVLLEKDDFTLVTKDTNLKREMKGCYISDLLSWVMAHASEGDVWVTIMSHVNIVAVATLLDVSAIVVPESEPIPEDTQKKANEEGVTIFTTSLSAYEVAKVLSSMGV